MIFGEVSNLAGCRSVGFPTESLVRPFALVREPAFTCPCPVAPVRRRHSQEIRRDFWGINGQVVLQMASWKSPKRWFLQRCDLGLAAPAHSTFVLKNAALAELGKQSHASGSIALSARNDAGSCEKNTSLLRSQMRQKSFVFLANFLQTKVFPRLISLGGIITIELPGRTRFFRAFFGVR